MAKNNKGSEADTDVKEKSDSDKPISQQSLILEVKPTLIISEGKHTGIITKLQHRTVPFGYIDIFIKEKKTEAELRAGFGDKITERTALGKFLVKMGVNLEVGVNIDLQKELLGREVTFMSENEETDKGVFARIIRGTVKPLE